MCDKINMNLSQHALRYKKYVRLIRQKPAIAPRIVRNYFDLTVRGKKVLRKVEMGVTFNCQCKCAKCSSAKMRNRSREKLTLEEIGKVADEIIALGALQMNFTGGEPLLEPNLAKIVHLFHPRETIITINTNGHLLDRDRLLELLDAGVDVFKLSLDSPVPEEHDRSRGMPGLYDQVIAALEEIQRIPGAIGQISIVTTAEILDTDRIRDLVRLAEKYDAFLGLTIPSKSGRWSADNSILLRPEHQEILDSLVRHPRVTRDTDSGYITCSCPAGSEELYLTCYGDVIPCPLIQISFGNVREESVSAIWARMSAHPAFCEKVGVCRSGQHEPFIRDYLDPVAAEERFPVPIFEHPTERSGGRHD